MTPKADNKIATKADLSKPAVHIRILLTDQLLGRHDSKVAKASINEVTFDPLAASMPHRHPRPVSGYVLEGTFEF